MVHGVVISLRLAGLLAPVSTASTLTICVRNKPCLLIAIPGRTHGSRPW
jgi:hypothetical protein